MANLNKCCYSNSSSVTLKPQRFFFVIGLMMDFIMDFHFAYMQENLKKSPNLASLFIA